MADKIRARAKDLLKVIEANIETVKGESYIKYQYIIDEMEDLKNSLKLKKVI